MYPWPSSWWAWPFLYGNQWHKTSRAFMFCCLQYGYVTLTSYWSSCSNHLLYSRRIPAVARWCCGGHNWNNYCTCVLCSLTTTLCHKCPIPISPLYFNFSTILCAEIFYIMNIGMQAGFVCSPPTRHTTSWYVLAKHTDTRSKPNV